MLNRDGRATREKRLEIRVQKMDIYIVVIVLERLQTTNKRVQEAFTRVLLSRSESGNREESHEPPRVFRPISTTR